MKLVGEASDVVCRINQLKKQIQADRILSVQQKHEKNTRNLENEVSQLAALAESRTTMDDSSGKLLLNRMSKPLCKINSCLQGSGNKDYVDAEDVVWAVTTKLPLVDKIPPYTTWIFLHRNQRMADDQSVVGRRRIYYDQHGSEALICSDSEEETEVEGQKYEFSKGEDRILWMVTQEFELNEEILEILNQFVGGTTAEIQERYNFLKDTKEEPQENDLESSVDCGSLGSLRLERSLSASLDSFDNLFCRRCLVFDCRLHGCSQNIVYPGERKSLSSDSDEDRKPCGDQCYLKFRSSLFSKECESQGHTQVSDTISSDPKGETLVSANPPDSVMATETEHHGGKRWASEQIVATHLSTTPVSDGADTSSSKKMKLPAPDAVITEVNLSLDHSPTDIIISKEFPESKESEVQATIEDSTLIFCKNASNEFSGFNASPEKSDTTTQDHGDHGGSTHKVPGLNKASSSEGNSLLTDCEWKPLEKDLFLKGIEIFGRNSCLIARNLLSGLKTCMEVSNYMNDDRSISGGTHLKPWSCSEDYGKTDSEHMDPELQVRSRLLRKRGRTRRLKYSSKSAGHPLIWRRIADGKNQSCKQYTPCGCESKCGKQCSCLQNGTCCEKYCGCTKTCKNRFRGCHCAKSQCRSRQCPCFAAGRECDPDVCRNCWVSCGDGSLGEPPRQGDGHCGNMRLLLRQQQRILLAKSDVAGWGAFLKNPVNKNDYLGEYTGELISHREADKRGKIYDRANSSFLFDLNDQYVLDAYRKGDKLKFANHSSNPNCYAKVMMVAGDHRVGIFANERIEGSEELFYDYRYGPDQAPAWARKPDDSKRDDSLASQGRARKHQ
ncbi:histone modifying enzyme [Lithospermum erythrorhizon]|uniref:[histone H3]-lysine(27) N-trimethyltransferase n=1 Tax=Lithospermum erythrorhizon TaxID=34254 RepID=A0AAV3Q666_LITER